MSATDVLAVAAVASSIFAATSAIVAAVSAIASRRAIAIANAAFVWPTVRLEMLANNQAAFYIKLHNDGPGPAFDVRLTTMPDERDNWVMPSIRAMRPGETVPPTRGPAEEFVTKAGDEFSIAGPEKFDLRTAVVAVRYEDSLGKVWEVREPLDPHRKMQSPRQLRPSRHSPRCWLEMPHW